MKKLNILQIADVFYPDILSGAGRYLYDLSRFLIKRGHSVTVLTRKYRGLSQSDSIAGIDVKRFKWGNPILSFFDERVQIAKILESKKIDIVFFNQPLSAHFGLKLLKKIPKIYFFHSPWQREYEIKMAKSKFLQHFSTIYKRVEKSVLKKSDKIITLSEFTKNLIITIHNISEDKIIKIPGGVDLSLFNLAVTKASARKHLNLLESKVILLTIRNLVARMGLENFILSARILKTKIDNFLIVIGGEGPLFEKLKNMVKVNQLNENIIFTDRISEENLPYYYRACDLFILPTLELEGFGLITIEAMASGRIVLGTPVGATTEILSDFDKNLLIDGTGPEAIAKKIVEYIGNNTIDEKILRGYVEKKYSWEIIAEEVESVAMSLK